MHGSWPRPPDRPRARSWARVDRVRLGALCGLSAAALSTAGWIVGGLLQPSSYSWSAQEISDLGALTARHAWVWNAADSLSGLLLLPFAAALYVQLGASRAGRRGAALIGVVGVGSVLDGVLREDCPLSTSRACRRLQETSGLSWHHHAHTVESVIVFAAMLIAPFLVAGALRRVGPLRRLRPLSLGTGTAVGAGIVSYLALYGSAGAGIAERAAVLVFAAWIALLAASAWRGLLQVGVRREAASAAEVRSGGV